LTIPPEREIWRAMIASDERERNGETTAGSHRWFDRLTTNGDIYRQAIPSPAELGGAGVRDKA